MDKYARVKTLGKGSFGAAILVTSRADPSEKFVVKEVDVSRMPRDEREAARLEAQLLAALHHPNIVTCHESFTDRGKLCIVMDYCERGDLYQLLKAQRGAPLPERRVVDMFTQLLLGLKHVHDRKVLHRDLKTQNVFVAADGTLRLGDFGVSKVLSCTTALASTAVGTPYYLSPEICENKPYDHKSDVWSLGCVLYEMLTLTHPFEGASLKLLILKIIRGKYPPVSARYGKALRDVLDAMLSKNPAKRPGVNDILKKAPFKDAAKRLLEKKTHEDEFSHTVIHAPRRGAGGAGAGGGMRALQRDGRLSPPRRREEEAKASKDPSPPSAFAAPAAFAAAAAARRKPPPAAVSPPVIAVVGQPAPVKRSSPPRRAAPIDVLAERRAARAAEEAARRRREADEIRAKRLAEAEERRRRLEAREKREVAARVAAEEKRAQERLRAEKARAEAREEARREFKQRQAEARANAAAVARSERGSLDPEAPACEIYVKESPLIQQMRDAQRKHLERARKQEERRARTPPAAQPRALPGAGGGPGPGQGPGSNANANAHANAGGDAARPEWNFGEIALPPPDPRIPRGVASAMYRDVGTAERRAVFLENRAAAERNRMRAEREARGEPPVEDVVDEAATARRLPPPRPSKPRPSSAGKREREPRSRGASEVTDSESGLGLGARECECDRPSSPLSEEEARRKAFWDGRRAAERNRRRAEENENERSTEGHVSVIERHVSADAYLGASTATPEDIAAAAGVVGPRDDDDAERRLRMMTPSTPPPPPERGGGGGGDAPAALERSLDASSAFFPPDSPPSTVFAEGGDVVVHDVDDAATVGVPSSASLPSRIEHLRAHLQDVLGESKFVRAYRALDELDESQEETETVETLLHVMGADINYLGLIHQLLVCEDSLHAANAEEAC